MSQGAKSNKSVDGDEILLSSSDDEDQVVKAKDCSNPNLHSLLADLGSEAAIRDPKVIPNIARQIWAHYIPKSSMGLMLDVLAETTSDSSIRRPHRLAVFYVYHEWLIQAPNIQKQAASEDGIRRFL